MHPADVQDRDAAHWVLGLAKPLWCWLRTIVADGAYRGSRVNMACLRLGWTLIIVFRRKKTLPFGPFEPVPKRWIVERTFGWLGRWRRLARDYEDLPQVSRAMVQLAMIRLMVQRLTTKRRPRLSAKPF